MTNATHTPTCLFGRDVYDCYLTARDRQVCCFESNSLCDFQRDMQRAGYLEAEIVPTIFGFSLRYASGLQEWGIIAGHRSTGESSRDAILAAAQRWQAQSPTRNFVTIRASALAELDRS